MTRTCESSSAFRKTAADPPAFKPTAADVVAAVESLYADEVRPHGRILLKRLGERAASEAAAALFATVSHRNLVDNVPRIDANRLRKVCERCRQLRVVAEESGEYSALLAGRRETFVDATVNADGYPEQLWLAASAFFAGPQAAELVLPGGRYACAQALMSLGLPFLAGYSLGRVCHIVQLAISKRRILGYLNGQVVPYRCSEAVVKEACAQQQTAAVLGPRAVPALPLATLEQSRSCLWEMLSGEDGKPISVPLPNVKRLFRSRFNLDLSETALGQSRLCELLQDARFRDVCTVHLHGNGYIVVRAEQSRAPPSPESWPAYQPAAPVRQPAAAAKPEQEPACHAPTLLEALPACQHSPVPRQACVPASPETWPTYQLKLADRLAKPAAPSLVPPPCLPPVFYGSLPEEASLAPPPAPPSCPQDECWKASDSDATESTAEGSPEHRCDESDDTQSADESPHCLLQWPSEWAVGDVLDDEFRAGGGQARSSLFAQPLGEPLGMESELTLMEPPASTPLILQDGHWSALMSPSVLADDGCIGSRVKNTFLHLSPLQATPIGTGARRRTCSVPKEVGSSKDQWETSCDTMLFRPDGVASPTYIVPSPALRAAASEEAEAEEAPLARGRRVCWSPGSPSGGIAETLRLWNCTPPRSSRSVQPSPRAQEPAEASTPPRPRVCWSPGSPSDGIAETLRLWNCTPSRPSPPVELTLGALDEDGWRAVPKRRQGKAQAPPAAPWRVARGGPRRGAASPKARRAGA